MSNPAVTKVRIDSWVWAVRLYRTRSLAAAACRAGHVRVDGEKVKPAHAVSIGDEVRARSGDEERIVIVSRLVVKRVGAVIAAECFIDKTPAPIAVESAPAVVTRERGAGRPTKRQRRDIERLRGH
jgi:ribosome-associated heat shock protein Hsp15